MHVLVACSGNATLETALLDAGHRVTLLVPADTVEQRRADTPRADGVFGISRWHDPIEATRLLPLLPADLDRVATIDEQAVARPCAVIRERLGLPGLTVADALAHTDKDVAKRRLSRAGIRVARHLPVRSGAQVAKAGEELGWPVVVKPARGAGATNTFVVEDKAHLDRLIRQGVFDRRVPDSTGRFGAGEFLLSLNERPGGFLVEEFIRAKEEWFVDLYLHEGELLGAFPGRYSAPLLGVLGRHQWDAVVPASHRDAREVVKLALQASRALGSGTGVVHCEILRTPDREPKRQWVFGEAAHRPGGGGIATLYCRQHGLDLPPILAALAVGERPDIRLDAAPPTLANLVIAAPPGTVRRVATADELLRLDGVLDAQVNLTPGQRTPGNFGTMSLAGAVTLRAESLDDVARRCEALVDALGLEVTGPQTQVEGCVR
ncbi:ATP-binding protein [Streptacidiphilus neutrinimicus]|uniref:ATP-binding protein n=1 Tax=Streptacidiphilus neutrinimicus TaxID=105420 RepID=UPI0005A6F552|nr:hypothetical protein [Streptacidiphilus neutrinimicus]